jgi:hypothetical protein
MLIDTSTREIALPPARLLIHTDCKGNRGRRRLESLRWWLRSLYAQTHFEDRAPLRLRIDDLKGNRLFENNDVGALLDVALPAGTYQVTARFGNVRRGYTLTLAQGTSFDLFLRHPPETH